MERKDILELLRKIIAEETRYLRHYIAQVVDIEDPDSQGKVRATVPALGWDTDEVAPWIFPRAMNSLQTPKVGQWIEVYFLNGDRNKPVYVGQAVEMEDSSPTLYEGDTDNQVLFEDPDNGEGIRYKKGEGLLEIFQAVEAAVLGDTLKTHLDNIKLYLDSHVHPGVMSGGASTSISTPSPLVPTITSSKVKLE